MGKLKAGYLADLRVADGDPLRAVRILQDQTRLKAIMQYGKFFKNVLEDAATP